MPITVVANGTNSPPHFEITISTPDGSAMTAVTLNRQASGVTAPTRVQPTAGLASRYVEDPEAPWDTPVVYSATVTYNGGASSATMVATAATLTPTPAAFWAIHPTIPPLSMPLDTADPTEIGFSALGDAVYAAQATQHKILGSKYPTMTKIGTRLAPALQVQVTTVVAEERTALAALIDDETPLLLRAPAAWGWQWEDGYYAVADAAFARRLQYGAEPSRTVTLPLQRVMPPAGVQQSSWSWGGLLAGYPDWPSVAAAFADWNAVTGNHPS